MSAAKAIRDKFGLSQLELAHLLGITRSQIAMSETNQRELPTAALRQISEIEILLAANPAATAKAELPTDETQVAKAIAQLQKLVDRHEHQLYPQ